MDGDFDDATYEEIFIINDANIGSEFDSPVPFILGDAPPHIGLVHPDVRQIIMAFAAD